MSGGLKPQNHFGIMLLVGALLTVGLYFLPKTVISTDGDSKEQSASTTSSSEDTESHTVLSSEQEQTLTSIKNSENLTEEEMNQSLVDFFSEQSIFDSAAYYSGVLAQTSNTEASWLQTADLYYQAYSLTLNPIKREEMAEKTREVYQRVLEINPNQLQAKTNMAMTYTTSSSPMQAILMLRQVLDEDPKFIPAIMSMGALSMQSGQYDKAVSRFQQVLGLSPTNINAKLGLAYSLIETGERAQAKEILLEVSKFDVGEVLQNEIDNTLKSLN
ncbi:tetratricopeptide repeat protein [uncultured Arcticibacterium sp.]|uniref:tetratricopeptide repeat protein n=1 Tax=uncultured Arcticibacterium sp. TaxID=2173042 RepID=UPI0030F8237A